MSSAEGMCDEGCLSENREIALLRDSDVSLPEFSKTNLHADRDNDLPCHHRQSICA